MGDQTFYDIYLVSTLEQTPQVDKIKDMCRKNGWEFTTPFGKLGELPMQSRQKAVETSSHVVLAITKDDCLMQNVKDSMTIEMAFESVKNGEIGGRVIPIRCCDRDFLPLLLRSLVGISIDDDDLEARMKITIDKGIRREREAQCRSMSGELKYLIPDVCNRTVTQNPAGINNPMDRI